MRRLFSFCCFIEGRNLLRAVKEFWSRFFVAVSSVSRISCRLLPVIKRNKGDELFLLSLL